MAALTPLGPDSDGTIDLSIDHESGRGTPYFTHIDESPDSPGSDHVTNDQSETDGDYFIGFDDVPEDFESMSQSLQIKHSVDAVDDGSSNDALDCYASIVASDESTAYTDEVIICDELDTVKATATDTWTVNPTGLAASKAEWNAAFIKLRWDYQKVAAGDNNQARIFAVELLGTYVVGAETFTIDLAGAQASAGTLVKQTNKPFAGAQASAGTLFKQVGKKFAGAQVTAGTLIKKISKVFAGVQATAGTIATSHTFVIALAGVQATAGVLVKQANKVFAGAQASAGTLVKSIGKVFAGAQASAGTLIKKTKKVFAGVQASAGTLVEVFQGGAQTFTIALAGVQASAGTLVKQTSKSFAGTQATAGTLVKRIGKIFAGVQATAGTLLKAITKTFAGTQATAGTLIKQTQKKFAGSQATSGTIGAVLVKFVGFVARLFSRPFTATLEPRAFTAQTYPRPFTATLEPNE